MPESNKQENVNTTAILDKIVDKLYDYNSNPQSEFEEKVKMQADSLKQVLYLHADHSSKEPW